MPGTVLGSGKVLRITEEQSGREEEKKQLDRNKVSRAVWIKIETKRLEQCGSAKVG